MFFFRSSFCNTYKKFMLYGPAITNLCMKSNCENTAVRQMVCHRNVGIVVRRNFPAKVKTKAGALCFACGLIAYPVEFRKYLFLFLFHNTRAFIDYLQLNTRSVFF